MLTPALSRKWQIVYSSVKDAGTGQQSDPWHGLFKWNVRMLSQASYLRLEQRTGRAVLWSDLWKEHRSADEQRNADGNYRLCRTCPPILVTLSSLMTTAAPLRSGSFSNSAGTVRAMT